MEVKECPQCGATAKPSSKHCEYCKAEFFITSIAYLSGFDDAGVRKYLQHYQRLVKANGNDIEGHVGLGLCYLQLNMFPLAQRSFDNVIANAPDLSQSYYYRCLAVIAGRRIKSLSLSEVREIEVYLKTAIQLDASAPHYQILLAMVKHDYYLVNGMKEPTPTYEDIMQSVSGVGINDAEGERLKQCTRVADYSIFGL